jgi:ribosome biogenesis protein Nip4
MKKGLGKFEYYFIQVDLLLKNAAKTNNPALFLYENDFRTKAFMLQGLGKLYSGLHNPKRFTKLKDAYKALEDLLGAIDYYDNFSKTFEKNKSITPEVKKYIADKKLASLLALNELLVKQKWIGSTKTRTNKQRKKISSAKWQTETVEIEAIKKHYIKQVENIVAFYTQTKGVFTDLENQVHELRRKLRWLSIYPQALQGSIQLIDDKKIDAAVKKYLTKEIAQSPFNKLPAKGSHSVVLQLNKNYFLALSHTIAALGKLKDKGQTIHLLSETIQATEKLSAKDATVKAIKTLKLKATAEAEILKEASNICKVFFKENNLEKLVL